MSTGTISDRAAKVWQHQQFQQANRGRGHQKRRLKVLKDANYLCAIAFGSIARPSAAVF
jgi:hypothetical protein